MKVIVCKKIKQESMTFGKHKITIKHFKRVKGHDDSLSYTCILYVNNKKCCEAYNDGWGGSAMLTIIDKELFELIDNVVIQYPIMYGKKEIGKYTLSDVADELACLVCDNKSLWKTIREKEFDNFVFYNGASVMTTHYTTPNSKLHTALLVLFKTTDNYVVIANMIKRMCTKGYKCYNTNVPKEFIKKFNLEEYFMI